MKISFKVLDGNKVASNNNKVLSQYIIDESFLVTALSVIYDEEAIFKMIEKKCIFVVLPMNGKDSDYRVCDAFVVRRNDGSICIWSNLFIDFEDGDAIFTTLKDAEMFALELNSVTKNKKLQYETDKSIKSIESYIDNAQELCEKIAAYCKNINEKEKLLFDIVIKIIENDIKTHINALEQLEMLKRSSPFDL